LKTVEIAVDGIVIDTLTNPTNVTTYELMLTLSNIPFEVLQVEVVAIDYMGNVKNIIYYNLWFDLTPPSFSLCISDLPIILPNITFVTWEWDDLFFKGFQLFLDGELIEDGDDRYLDFYQLQLNALSFGTHLLEFVISDVGDNQVSCLTDLTVSETPAINFSGSSTNWNIIYWFIGSSFLVVLVLIRLGDRWLS
jgi:hypothetical protein